VRGAHVFVEQAALLVGGLGHFLHVIHDNSICKCKGKSRERRSAKKPLPSSPRHPW
jgi:hypothetical protein